LEFYVQTSRVSFFGARALRFAGEGGDALLKLALHSERVGTAEPTRPRAVHLVRLAHQAAGTAVLRTVALVVGHG